MLWDLNLTTHLGVLEGPNVVYMEKMDVYPNTRLYTQVGYRSPAYCSSMGKCLLACLSGEELDRTLSCCDFHRYTPNTIVDKDELKRQLKEVRVAGWAMAAQYHTDYAALVGGHEAGCRIARQVPCNALPRVIDVVQTHPWGVDQQGVDIFVVIDCHASSVQRKGQGSDP